MFLELLVNSTNMNEKVKNTEAVDFEGEQTLNNFEAHYPDITIKMTKEQFSVFELKRRYEKSGTLKMNPDFQREGNLWAHKQKSELIESILMGIPIPIIYLFEDDQGCKQVVDGRQRLSSIFDFLNGKYRLRDIKILNAHNGFEFKDLNPQFQAKLEDYQFLAYTIQHPTPEKVKFDIFDRVNRGGTQLNNQEMRNALYLGKVTELLNTLVKSEIFLKATGKSVSSKRMKDKYIVLRFLGFFLLRTGQLKNIEYKSDVDEFLADVMLFINRSDNSIIERLEYTFMLAMDNCYKVLGEDAFRFRNNGKKRPINMGLFECLSYMLSIKLPENINYYDIELIINELKDEMDKSQMFMGIIDTTKGVAYRFNKADKIREDLLNVK